MNPYYLLGWSLFRFVFAVYFRWRVFNPERVPEAGPVILAANHASAIDPPLIGAGVTRCVHMLARDTLFRFPVFGWVLRKWEAVPVDREGGGAAGLRAILHSLENKQAILLFPEGTRTRDGRLQPARSGIGLIVVKSGAPVVPVRVFGTFEAYPRHKKIPRPRRIAIKYGEPLRFDELCVEAQHCSKARLKEIYQEIADRVMGAIAKLEPHADKSVFP
jgi:1-acyl-sn-glycerol-3-phosphate acyltransferase